MTIFSTLSLIFIISKSVSATASLRLRSEWNALCFDCVSSTYEMCGVARLCGQSICKYAIFNVSVMWWVLCIMNVCLHSSFRLSVTIFHSCMWRCNLHCVQGICQFKFFQFLGIECTISKLLVMLYCLSCRKIAGKTLSYDILRSLKSSWNENLPHLLS